MHGDMCLIFAEDQSPQSLLRLLILPSPCCSARHPPPVNSNMLAETWVASRGVHGNGEDWDPMGPMGFPREWE